MPSVQLATDDRVAAAESSSSDAADRAMARYAEGDASAFQEVFALVGPRLLKFLRRLSGAQSLAEDLLQETMLRMHQARGNFVLGMPVLPWAYAIARNCYLDTARAARRRPVVLDNGEPSDRDPSRVAPDADGEQQLIAHQTAAAVERALSRMTVLRREAFVLLRYEGLSLAVAAQVLGASEGAVKVRAFHAYEEIRRELAKLESP